MTALASYSTGLATVSAGGTTVTGSGTIWSGTNVKPGDILQIGNFQSVISDVTDTTHLVIPPWGGGVQTSVAYVIWQVSPQRFAGATAMQTVNDLVAAFSVSGFVWFVAATLTAPDPSYGDDGQYAWQPSTGAWWLKTGGVWVSSGSPASGYGGTSTTSLAIGTGSKAFTTQQGLAYNGARVRAAAASDATKWMEGVATYSGTTLTIGVDKVNGSGTFASWTFAIAGQPATGDVVGPASATDNAAARFDTTTGELVQDSALLIADTTGALSRSGNGGISVQGTNTNDSAPSGYVGEYGSTTVSVSPGVSFVSTNNPVNLASVSLPAGDYDVWGNAVYVPGGSSVVTQCLFWISTTSATNPGNDSGDTVGFGFGSGITGGAASHIGLAPKRISLSATTTVYLSGQVSFTGSVPTAGATIKWRRRR